MFAARNLFFASLIAIAMCTSLTRNMQVHEFRPSAPAGFSRTGAADPNATLKLRIALVQNNIAELQEKLIDVSTPASSNYGQHLTKEEVEQYVAPSQDSIDAVNAWLAENNITATTISPAGDWLSFEVPIEKANNLFDADFSIYTHTSGMQTVRTLSYSIPAELEGHLDLVYPTITFPAPYTKLPVSSIPKSRERAENLGSRATVPSSCTETITPACLQAIYNIPTTPATESSNRIAVSGYVLQYANEADLESFLTTLRPDMNSSTTFTLDTLDGGVNPQDPSDAGGEANLDIQYTVGLATDVPVDFVSVGLDTQDGALGGLLDLANYLLAMNIPPYTWTTSYLDNEEGMSSKVANQLCNAYVQLGARGVSVLFGSGDGGVSGVQPGDCTDFVPTFPSGCPYMTSVGGTQGYPESAADFSTGGLSNIFPRPSYQSDAVESYLATLGSTNVGLFNTSGRAFPDVSTQSVSFEIAYQGRFGTVGGTSCASPTFASMIALLNDRLIAAGKSPLGFLNPFLYSTGTSALNDITSGSNPGCNTTGFPAAPGWDPITGLGTPDFAKLLTAVGL